MGVRRAVARIPRRTSGRRIAREAIVVIIIVAHHGSPVDTWTDSSAQVKNPAGDHDTSPSSARSP